MIGKQLVFFSLLVIKSSTAQDANCDFRQSVSVGTTYYVYSPGYPGSYSAGSQCRWIATCPTGCNCQINCSEINMPNTANCAGDRLLVSKTGDPTLTSAEKYCGKGTLIAQSSGPQLAIGMVTTANTAGGRFICELKAVPASTTPQTCSCGYKKTNRIVGGSETSINEFTMMAALYDTRLDTVTCGAVIIATRYLITAAHCFYGQNIADLQIIVGAHDIYNPDSPATTRIPISDYLIHPNFNVNNGYDYDIALIQTTYDIQFSQYVGPVCLPFKYYQTSFAGAKATLLGWGTTFSGGPTSDTLLKVDVDVISQSACSSQMSGINSRMMCTYTPGKDACQHDSGGPVLYTDSTTGRIFSIGVVSNGNMCASGPGVNTRLTEMLGWVVSSTPDANYCRV